MGATGGRWNSVLFGNPWSSGHGTFCHLKGKGGGAWVLTLQLSAKGCSPLLLTPQPV